MKRKLLICMIFLGIISTTWAYQSSILVTSSDPEKEIELYGSLSNIPTRSLLPDPIEAFINTFHLSANFLNNLGNIDVVVYNESGTIVYQQTVNTQTKQQLTIDVYSWNEGVYQIKFINSAGQFMYGTFEIE